MTNHDQLVFAQVDHLELAVFGRVGHQAHIHHVAEHVFVDLVGTAILHVHVDGGITFQELLDVGRQIMQADAVNCRNPNGSGDDVFDLLELAVERIVGLDDLLAVLV